MNVEFQHISKSFGVLRANDDISFMIKAGSIHGLLGENGAGKSTLVKILSGFLFRDRGTILLDGQPVSIRSPWDGIRFGIGMLHQDPLDFPPMTVLDNFMIGKPGWLTRRHQARQQFNQWIHQFNFKLDADELVTDLTVGERQQLEIVRLLSLGVKTLILDEPTTGISAVQKDLLFAAVRQLAQKGQSIIFVSHKLEDVNSLCDRLTVMRQGKIAGHLTTPCQDSAVIQLIFDRELSLPVKSSTRQEETLLELTNIKVQGDRIGLAISHLAISKGEVIGLAGLEGNGQQLLLQMCAGLVKPTKGTILIHHQDLTSRPYRDYLKAGVGYSPADRLGDGLIPGLSIHEHLALRTPSPHWFIHWKHILETTHHIIELFNIRGKPHTKVEHLSGGNQQRTQIALLPIPLNVLLMEHPTRGLDIESGLWIWQQLMSRCEGGTTILFMSSDLDEIMQYSDRVLVFCGGHVSEPIEVTSLTVERLGRLIGGRFENELTTIA